MGPHKAISLRWRVTLGASAILVGALVLAALASAGLVQRALTNDVEGSLTDRVEQVDALLRSGQLPEVLSPSGREVGQVQVIDDSGAVVAATPGLAGVTRFDVFEAPAVGAQRVETVSSEQIDGDADERFRVVARTTAVGDTQYSIWAISSLDAAISAQRYLRNGLLLGLPLPVALTLGLIMWVVRRALAPVDAMRAEVDRIETRDLSARVTAPESDDEIARLATTLNRLLDRVERSAARQRLFAAAASHELRSPLSAIRTELEVGLAYPDRAEWPLIARESLIEVDRLEVLSRDLRALTRVRDQAQSGDEIDLAELVAGEVARRSGAGRPRIVTNVESALVRADADSVVQVLRNLLDNAERHANGTIEAGVRRVADGVLLRVANDGPAVPVAERERIFEPFTRLDEARAAEDGGSGLGLAIARSTMHELGGRLDLADEAETAFLAWFPAAASG